MDLNFALFEPFMGHIPYRVEHFHPDGSLASMAIVPNKISPCAIWDLQTYKMVWAPGTDGITLCWSPDGKEIGILRPCLKHLIWSKKDTKSVWYTQQEDLKKFEEELEREKEWRKELGEPWILNVASYTGSTNPQALIKRYGLATSWSSDGVIWERRSWPEEILKGSCLINTDFLPFDVLISPQHTIAALLWYSQCMDDVIVAFIALTESGDYQLPDSTIRMGWSWKNGQLFPLFSPDNRYLVLAWQEHPDNWWWVDSALDHALRYEQAYAPVQQPTPLMPADAALPIPPTPIPSRQGREQEGIVPAEASVKVGERCIGYLDIIDWQESRRHSIPITTMLPTHGHLPSFDFGFGPPEFLNHEHIRILLPTGEIKTYQITAP